MRSGSTAKKSSGVSVRSQSARSGVGRLERIAAQDDEDVTPSLDYLERDPSHLRRCGSAPELLHCLMNAGRVDEITPFLRHEMLDVRRVSIWIASESRSCLENSTPSIRRLVDDADPFVRYHVIGALACSGCGARFATVAAMIGDPDPAVRWRAMRMLRHGDPDGLHRAQEAMLRDGHQTHAECLGRLARALAGQDEGRWPKEAMLSADVLTRRYGAIVASLANSVQPESSLEQLGASQDPDLRGFTASLHTWGLQEFSWMRPGHGVRT